MSRLLVTQYSELGLYRLSQRSLDYRADKTPTRGTHQRINGAFAAVGQGHLFANDTRISSTDARLNCLTYLCRR